MAKIIFCSLSDWEISNLSNIKLTNLEILAILQYHEHLTSGDSPKYEFISIEKILKLILMRDFAKFDLTEITPEYVTGTQKEQLIAIEMMRRIDSTKNFSIADRKEIYFNFSVFWLKKLKELQPDAIYFGVVPHEVGDYILYVVAQHLGIETLINIEAYVLGRRRICKSIDIPQSSHPAISYQKYKDSNRDLSLWLTDQTKSKVRKHVQWMAHIDKLRPNKYENLLLLRSLKRLIAYFFSKSSNPRLELADWAKLSRIKLERDQLNFGKIIYTFKKFLGLEILNFERRLIAYDRDQHSLNELIEGNFVVYFLSYQPEMLVSPSGGDFFDQIQNISIIASNLPQGWKLVVKEHPAQEKDSYGYNYLGRDPLFYSKICSIKNVYLISTHIQSYEVILRSRGVATISGTAGWQALVLSKPVLVFGNVWYGSAPRVYQVDSSASVKDFLSECQKLVANKNEHFSDLLNFLEDYCENSLEIQTNEVSSNEIGIFWDEKQNQVNWNILINQICSYF